MKSNPSRGPLHRRIVWAVPALTATAVVASALLTSTAHSSPHPTLPPRTAAQLLVEVQSSENTNLSGTIVETTRFGLPSLPDAGGGASLSWQSLITGTHTAQVWMAGPQKQRVALKGTLSESDVIHNGQDLWTYTSDSNEVSHTVLARDAAGKPPAGTIPDARASTPTAAARAALQAISPTTAVTVDSTQRVAGRKAYTLVLKPRDTRSTVSRITIAIDSTHFVPLRVQVFGTGSTPAFETGFIGTVSFAIPKASVFNFHPPAGATVAQNPFGPQHGGGARKEGEPGGTHPLATDSPPKVIGTGWTSIVEFPSGLPTGSAGSLIDRLTTPVGASGNKLLTTSLLNVLFMKDGRVFLGPVRPTLLEITAAATPR